ncbi:alcohol dehydrogenase [Ilyonectria robusta]
MPKHFDYVKALGADVVFDNISTTVVHDMKRATGGRLKYVLDCISKEPTKKISVGASGDNGGIYTTLLPIPAELVYSINDKVMSKFMLD